MSRNVQSWLALAGLSLSVSIALGPRAGLAKAR